MEIYHACIMYIRHSPTVFSASSQINALLGLGFHACVCIDNICARASTGGRGKANSRSNLPGLRRAGSMESNLQFIKDKVNISIRTQIFGISDAKVVIFTC